MRRQPTTLAVVFCIAFLSSDSVHAIRPRPPALTLQKPETNLRTTAADARQQQQQQQQLLQVPAGGAQESKKATIAESVFNLVNNVAGAGILTLSAGMATGTGWIPAIIICSVLGAIGSHSFCIIGAACELTGQQDFKGLWSKTIGEDSTYLVDSIIAVMCFAACVIYSGILGDVFTPLLDSVGFPAQYNKRTWNILFLTVAALLPMSLIKNLSALAFTSILGFSAIVYTVIFVVIRALDGSYKIGLGKFLEDGTLSAITFQGSKWAVDFTSLVLASNLGLAYIAHYNGPAFYRELENTNSKRFNRMVRISFTILTLLYIIIMVSGYSTFGKSCMGNILLNYHPTDPLAWLGRVATGFSILFGFPLVAAGAREGVAGTFEGLGFPGIASRHTSIVVTLLALITFVACTVKDVSLVVGLTGAAMGSLIVYIIPAIIYMRAVDMQKKTGDEYKWAKANGALVPFGIAIGGLGVYMTIKEYLSKL